jgi:hypothetical protein
MGAPSFQPLAISLCDCDPLSPLADAKASIANELAEMLYNIADEDELLVFKKRKLFAFIPLSCAWPS